MAITALKTGAKLPIKICPRNKPPPPHEKQTITQTPYNIKTKLITFVFTPFINISDSNQSQTSSDSIPSSPEVFESIIHASFPI
jgi:hypothetical protein